MNLRALTSLRWLRLDALNTLPSLQDIKNLLNKHWHKLALVALFGLGLFLGVRTAAVGYTGWQAQVMALLQAQRSSRAGGGMLANALSYFGGDMIFLAIAYIFGLSAGGLPLLLVLPVLRGLGIGVLSGGLYLAHGATGVGYALLVHYPATVISMLIMFSACKESMLMSGDMLLLLNGKIQRAESSLKRYSMCYVVLVVTSVIAAIVDAITFTVFSGIFDLY
ncbi:MAG: stage II sporulation protein M [Oscillospiraceae bacterium]|nr:stage II sporulation protein M [Oscillospiraceae bacterium]